MSWAARLAGTIWNASVVVALAGCRTGTQITAFPRVDLDLSGGNRGYLVGTPPPEPQLKTTRQMVETTIELPSFYKPKRTHRPVSLDGGPQPTTELPPASAASDTWQQVPAPGEYTK